MDALLRGGVNPEPRMSRLARIALAAVAVLFMSIPARAGNGPSGPASVSGPPALLSADQRAAIAAKETARLQKMRAVASPTPAVKLAPVTTVGPPVDRATAERAARAKVLAITRQLKIANANDRARQTAKPSGVESTRHFGPVKSPDRGTGLTAAPSGATQGSAQP